MIILSLCAWVLTLLCCAYLWLIALASVPSARRRDESRPPRWRFAIAIPAHDEEAVIGDTVAAIKKLDYPQELVDVYVVADFCTDATAQVARAQGARCFERTEGIRGGKAAALGYLFGRILEDGAPYGAVAILDADTQVHPQFLRLMNNRLDAGAQVVQGQRIIINPRTSWFSGLTWVLASIENRFSNQGRQNLGLSAKHMGDSICFRADILRAFGWGSGLTEDYDLWLRLLLRGIHIQYEPNACGFVQAPETLREGWPQRLRWAKGVADSGRRYRNVLLMTGLRQRDWSMLDGALSTFVPSYSTLSLLSVIMLFADGWLLPGHALAYLWGALTSICLAYPIFGLSLIKAPLWAYLAVMSGPFFILWRTSLSLRVRLSNAPISWVRTPHRSIKPQTK